MKKTGWKYDNDGSYGKEWRKLRKQAIARDSGFCVHCRKEGKLIHGTDVDHIIPRADGGTEALSNLQYLCVYHHQKKTIEEVGGTYKPKGCDSSGMPTHRDHPWYDSSNS